MKPLDPDALRDTNRAAEGAYPTTTVLGNKPEPRRHRQPPLRAHSARAFVASSPWITVRIADESAGATWIRDEDACGHAPGTGMVRLLSTWCTETPPEVQRPTHGWTTLSRHGRVWSQLGQRTRVITPSSCKHENPWFRRRGCVKMRGNARSAGGGCYTPL